MDSRLQVQLHVKVQKPHNMIQHLAKVATFCKCLQFGAQICPLLDKTDDIKVDEKIAKNVAHYFAYSFVNNFFKK